jgi:transposase-like protein
VQLAKDRGLIPSERQCGVCGEQMHFERDISKIDGVRWRCTRRCRRSCSIRQDSFFYGSKLSLSQMLTIMYSWSRGCKQAATMIDSFTNKNTIVDWYNFCRDVCVKALENHDVQKIGGVGKIVEIDESKFGKRKYHKGARREGQWVFGGVERGNVQHMFLEVVADRKKETLMDLIYKYIEPGTIIMSDCWKAYDSDWLNQLNFTHFTVNHSQNFKDPITGAHTNSIEGTWMHVKRSLNKNGTRKSLLASYFAEFIWRRRFLEGNVCPFATFLNHVALYHHRVPPPEGA